MSSILDALKKVEDDDNGPEGGVELNQEIDAAAAERDIVGADSDARKVTLRLTPAVMLVTLVVAVFVVTGIAAVTYFMTRPDTSAVPPARVASVPRVRPDAPAVSPQTAAVPNTIAPATVAVPQQPEPAAAEPAPAGGQPEPAAAEPAPAAGQPEPAAAEPVPAVAQPEPVAAEPAPAGGQPEPAAAEPVPAVGQPEPVAAEPAPAAGQPEPVAAEPTSAAEEPARDVVAEELRPARPKSQQTVPSQQAAAPVAVVQPVQPLVVLPVETAATFASDEPPPDIQSMTLPVEVPDLEINIIRAANAENPQPVAVINLKTVYEDDLIAGTEVRVLKINDDSIWFSYQGYRFSKRFK